jgi:tetratricopeptide (TPR) repeat protein
MSVEELTARVQHRVSTFMSSKDAAVVLDPAAEREAAALYRATVMDPWAAEDDDDEDVFAARFGLGWLYFLRHTEIKGEPGWPELARAVVCMAPYAATESDTMPATLDRLLGPGADHDVQAGFAIEFLTRSKQNDDPALLDAGIALLTPAAAALPRGDVARGERLSNLCLALRNRFERDGTYGDLNYAIAAGEEAVAIPGVHQMDPVHPRFNLAYAYWAWFDHVGNPDEMTRAIELLEAVAASFAPGPERSSWLYDAAQACIRLYRHSRRLEPLARAIDHAEEAIAAHSDNPAALSFLVAALQERHGFSSDAADLDRAIELGEQAVRADLADYGVRLNLAGAYFARYQYAGRLDDLEQVIAVCSALLADPAYDGGQRAAATSLRGAAYQLRFVSAHDVADLRRAIDHGEQAVAATDPDDPGLGKRLGRLAIAYQSGHDVGADPGYRAKAIEIGERAVAVSPEGDPDRAAWLSNLGIVYITPGFTAEPTRADLDRAVELSEQALAAHSVREQVRLVANLADAYRARTAAGGAGVGGARLTELARLVTETEAPPVDRVWGRHAVGMLAQTAGEHRLAAKLLAAAVELLPDVAPRHAGWADQQYRLGAHQGLVSAAVAAHCAAGDPAGAVEVVELGRGILLASQTAIRERPRLADLRDAVAGGAVVVVNTTRHRGDAVIVRADSDPVCIDLPGLRADEVRDRAMALTAATTDDEASLTGMLRRQRTLSEILGWLWDHIAEPVLGALPDAPSPHRIWWLPTGFLGVFPLHAAGHEGRPGALDVAVSSYIPTLRTLRDSRARAAPATRRQLVVALHRTPGLPDLPGTAEEAADLHARHPGRSLSDEDATTKQVLAALPEATWAHFACHAKADLLSPADGGLWLHDGPLRLSEIGSLQLPNSELAYLSACSTGHHGGRYADETLDLASAFHLVGFRHVIATLWPLGDRVAGEAARSFYERLPDTAGADSAAGALHQVTCALRDAEPTRPDLWATLIHSGP